jgi:hypothetical protein
VNRKEKEELHLHNVVWITRRSVGKKGNKEKLYESGDIMKFLNGMSMRVYHCLSAVGIDVINTYDVL